MANCFLGGPATVFLLGNWSSSSKLASIEIDRSTRVQAKTSTNKWFPGKFENSTAWTGSSLVRREFAYIWLLLENNRIFAKIAKNIIFDRTSSFFDFSDKLKKERPLFFNEKSETGLGFEIGQSQRKCQRRPTLQSIANPAYIWHDNRAGIPLNAI